MIRRYQDLPTWAKNLYSQTKGRAKQRGSEFTLTKERYAALVTDRCMLTGIDFDMTPAEKKHYKRPFAASIDRIDNSHGYTDDNVRLVCVAVNLALNSWGDEVLFRIAAGLIINDRDPLKWKRAGNVMPEGVKLESVSLNGPRFSARLRVGDLREYLGLHASVDEALEAIEEARQAYSETDITQLPPTEIRKISKSLILNRKIGRRDWTRTNSRRK